MPRVPLPNTHRKGVEILVHLVQDGDRLDDVLVGAVDVELDAGAGVGVGQTELCAVEVRVLEAIDETSNVETNSTQKLVRNVIAHT